MSTKISEHSYRLAISGAIGLKPIIRNPLTENPNENRNYISHLYP